MTPNAIAFILSAAIAGAVVQVTPDHIVTARKTLDGNLRDYQGSRFRNFRATRTGNKLSLCGEANLRNAAGGMTGWNPLAIVLEGDPIGPRIIAVEANGYTNLSEFAKACVLTGPTGSTGPADAQVGTDDITPALQPVENALEKSGGANL